MGKYKSREIEGQMSLVEVFGVEAMGAEWGEAGGASEDDFDDIIDVEVAYENGRLDDVGVAVWRAEMARRERDAMIEVNMGRAARKAELLMRAVDLTGDIGRVSGMIRSMSDSQLDRYFGWRAGVKVDAEAEARRKVDALRAEREREIGRACVLCALSVSCGESGFGAEELVEELDDVYDGRKRRGNLRKNMERVVGGEGDIWCRDAVDGGIRETRRNGKWVGWE